MPRKNPVPEDEQCICIRMRQAREASGLSRVNFAKQIGVDSVNLSNIEYARSPVRFHLGDRICRALNINQRWLATGQKPCYGYIKLSRLDNEPPRPDGLFSVIYRTILSSRVDKTVRKMAVVLGCKEDDLDERLSNKTLNENPGFFSTMMAAMINGELAKDADEMSIDLQAKLVFEMQKTFHDFLLQNLKKIVKRKNAKSMMTIWK